MAADGGLLLSLLPEREDPLRDFNAFETGSRRIVCFVPLCTSVLLDEILSSEVDAREYGLRTDEMPRWKIEALRLARTERALVEEKAMRPKNG